MDYQTLRLRAQPGVQFVQLYRPEADNALNRRLCQELTALFAALEADADVSIVVLEGLPQVFCSGMDFQEFLQQTPGEDAPLVDFFATLQQVSESSKVIVSKVTGKVNAGGVGLVAACDLVIADEGATFALSELLFGLLPAVVLPLLRRRVGHQRAKLLALSTQPISASEAHRWGLVDLYGPDPDRLLFPYLQRWRRLSSATIRTLKCYMNQLQPIDQATQNLAITTNAELMTDPAVRDGIRGYVEEGILPWMR